VLTCFGVNSTKSLTPTTTHLAPLLALPILRSIMQSSDMEFLLNLQKFALLLGLAVGVAIIVAAITLCFIATHTAAIRNELLKLRVNAEIASARAQPDSLG
jgi:hypothetical protein